MSDKNRNIDDDFFAKFDEIGGDKDSKVKSTDTYSAEDANEEFSAGSASKYRNRERSRDRDNRASRRERTAGRERPARTDRSARTSKSAKAKAVAASSKFGGSASGSKKRTPAAPESKKHVLISTLVSLVLIVVFAVGIYVGVVFIKAPIIDTDNIYSQISQRSVMYDTDGKEIDSLYFSNGNRTVIKYDQIPENMVNAIVSIEDHKFWTHNGFNFIRMVGAIKDSLTGGGDISGTSTVTQQLARNVYLADIKSQRTMSRKLTEMYCTIVLEKNMKKEDIMEAYLNTIYLGFNSYGVEAAAESYFNTTADKLNLEQCAALAALPSSPDVYALVYSDYYNSATSLPKIKKTNEVTYLYNGDLTKDRRALVLGNMNRLGYIDDNQYNKALAASDNLKKEIHIGSSVDSSRSSYFTDYALSKLIDDIMEEYDISETDAENMIYTKGLNIYTSLDSDIQNIMEEEFNNDSNYTTIAYTRTNSDGNLISDKGVVLAYKYSNYFTDDKFLLKKGEYKKNSDGSLTIYKDKRLNLYNTESATGSDISVEFKSMYFVDTDRKFYFIESGALSIPQQYKSYDDNNNCVVSAQFFSDYPNFFQKSEEGLLVSSDNYSLKQKVRQPQAAAVIIENKTGQVKAMMGGRGAVGKQLYNRAVNPRQPGSSIKPLATYGPALQMTYEYHEKNKKMALDTKEGSDWGKYITAGSVINDAPTKVNGRTWPRNDDGGYDGPVTFREAIQRSLNVCSYKIYQQIDMNEGAQYSRDILEKSGVTTLNDDDVNPAGLSLGGLTRGLTPLEEAAAYSVFPNAGVYKTPIFYTKVENSNHEVLFEKEPEETQVYDPGVAWIMCDVLRSVVTNGLGRNASIRTQPSAGKTGTTSNMYDIWFSGFTPQYSMALWMGNDINMSVSNYSYKAAAFWGKIMGRVCEAKTTARETFFEQPANVEYKAGEYYIKGTYSKVTKKKTKTKTKTESTTETMTLPTLPSPTDTTQPTTAPTTAPTPTQPPQPTPPPQTTTQAPQ